MHVSSAAVLLHLCFNSKGMWFPAKWYLMSWVQKECFLFPILTTKKIKSQIIQMRRQPQIPVQMAGSTLPEFSEEEVSPYQYQLGLFMTVPLDLVSAQLASTRGAFDKRKNALYLLHPMENDPRYLLVSGACLVFLGNKLLRKVFYYFTSLCTGLHIHTEILERRVQLLQSSDTNTPSRSSGVLCLRREPQPLTLLAATERTASAAHPALPSKLNLRELGG